MAIASQSESYPCIHWTQFTEFCKTIGFVEDQSIFTEEDLAFCFINTVYEPNKHIQEHEVPRDLITYEEKY